MRSQFINLIFVAAFLQSCASASKNVFFRTRVPSMESIDLGEDGKFGLALDFESKRFTIKTTNDLVSNFQFYKQDITFQNGKSDFDLSGIDLAGTYTDNIRQALPFQLALSLDFAELKVGLFDHRSNGIGWKGIVNGGYYRTSAYETAGSSCDFICFSDQATINKAKSLENDISLSYSGNETKLGTSIGYYFKEDQALYAGYNWYDARINVSAYKSSSGQKIEMIEPFYGSGYGLGYLFRNNNTYVGSFSVEHIGMAWNRETYQVTLLSFKNHFSF